MTYALSRRTGAAHAAIPCWRAQAAEQASGETAFRDRSHDPAPPEQPPSLPSRKCQLEAGRYDWDFSGSLAVFHHPLRNDAADGMLLTSTSRPEIALDVRFLDRSPVNPGEREFRHTECGNHLAGSQ